jgi:hypothetical protein
MWRMVMFGVEIPASVGGFSVNYCGQCHSFPDEQNIRKESHCLTLAAIVI